MFTCNNKLITIITIKKTYNLHICVHFWKFSCIYKCFWWLRQSVILKNTQESNIKQHPTFHKMLRFCANFWQEKMEIKFVTMMDCYCAAVMNEMQRYVFVTNVVSTWRFFFSLSKHLFCCHHASEKMSRWMRTLVNFQINAFFFEYVCISCIFVQVGTTPARKTMHGYSEHCITPSKFTLTLPLVFLGYVVRFDST